MNTQCQEDMKYQEYKQKYNCGVEQGPMTLDEIIDHIDWLEGFLENEYPVEDYSIITMIQFTIRMYELYSNLFTGGLTAGWHFTLPSEKKDFISTFMLRTRIVPVDRVDSPEEAADSLGDRMAAISMANDIFGNDSE